MVPKDWLLPPTPPQEKERADLVLLVQVAVFRCGGFVVGYRSSHAVADGAGAAQFMAAVGELERGAATVSVQPQWSREAMPDPSSSASVIVTGFPDPATGAGRRLEYLAIDVSADHIDRLKIQCDTAGGGGARCSAF